MNERLYRHYWTAKIVAWVTRQMVFQVFDEKRSIGFIVGKLNTAGWQYWTGSIK